MTARTWLIEGSDERCRVSCNNRELIVEVTLTEALRFIKRKRVSGDKIFHVDHDGYRRSIKAV